MILRTRPAAGKLEQAQAFNDRRVGPSCLRFEVRQNFAYNPTHGRLETQDTSLGESRVAQEVALALPQERGWGEVEPAAASPCLAVSA